MKKSIFTLLSLLSVSAYSLETDQFITANVTLKDASPVMNEYFQKSIERALETSNRKHYSCEKAALEVMIEATGRFSISKASTYAAATPLIERYPYEDVSEKGYRHQSYYQHAWISLQVVDLARTVNVNGVYVGTDKFGHFTHMGKNYYHNYLKNIKKGMKTEEAIEKAIVKGFNSEYGYLGYVIDGVLSYADLEANFQGMMFALDMCRGENPILIKDKDQWIENPNHPFDVKNYFNPKMDESYNLSFWRAPLYKRIEEKLKAEYCEAKTSPLFQERISFYNSIAKETLNDKLIKENILTQARFNRKLEDVAVTNCNN